MTRVKRISVVLALLISLLGIQTAYADTGGYITQWLVCGAFTGDGVQSATDPYFSTGTFPAPNGYTLGREWRTIRSDIMPVDFSKAQLNWGVTEHCTAYAAVYVYSPAAQNARLLIGCDDLYAAWLNDQQVGRSDAWQSFEIDKHSNAVSLRAGWNLLMLRITNGTVFWQYSARFVDASGNHIDGLKFQTDNPDANGLFARKLRAESELHVIAARMDDRCHISDGELVDGLVLEVANVGAAVSGSSDIRVTDSSHAVLLNQRIPSIQGDRTQTVQLSVPYQKLLQAVLTGDSKINVEYAGGTTSTSLDKREVLGRLFQPIGYDWTAELPNGQTTSAASLSEQQRSQVVSFRTKMPLPQMLRGYKLAAGIDVGGGCVAKAYVNSKEVKDHFSGDSGDILAINSGATASQFDVYIPINRGGKPRYNSGWLRVYIPEIEEYLKSASFANKLSKATPDSAEKELNGIIAAVQSGDNKKVKAAAASASNILTKYQAVAKQYTAHLLGHAHIDLAWLWQTSEMIQVTRDTFTSALGMISKYPDFKMSQSSAATYWWMEQYNPNILAQVKQRVSQGRWDPVGGTWSECDSNMPSGESLVRQFLYGQRYMKAKLGKSAKAGWAPDTFGHAWTLPQILTKGGIESYTFMRCRPADTPFWWKGMDGSRIFCSPTDNYNSTIGDWIGDRLLQNDAATKGGKDITVVYGVGDHGGGPTMRDIETAQQLDKVQVFPNVKFDTAEHAIKAIKNEKANYPVVNNELNSIFEGCYTSQAAVKQANRQLESLLPEAEAFSVISARYGGSYPSSDFFTAWRLTLFNQFHDIMDGSGIAPIYVDAAKEHADALELGHKALSASLDNITRNISVAADSVVVYNPMSWPRTDIVEMEWPNNEPVAVGLPGESQMEDGKLVFIAHDVPAMGYRVYPIRKGADTAAPKASASVAATLDTVSGCLSSLKDASGRELLAAGKLGNELSLHRETGDGWNIYPTGVVDKISSAVKINTIEAGPVRSIRRVTVNQGGSEYTQDVVQYTSIPRLDIRYKVFWQDRNTMLKSAFPIDITDASARFEIPFGSIVRPMNDKEVVTQKWVDISNNDYGVALLNDSKYGVSVSGNTINMTLLRQPNSRIKVIG